VIWQAQQGYAITRRDDVHEAFLRQLPFELTGAQVRAPCADGAPVAGRCGQR
jgi:ATP-dependent DNA helicase RecG